MTIVWPWQQLVQRVGPIVSKFQWRAASSTCHERARMRRRSRTRRARRLSRATRAARGSAAASRSRRPSTRRASARTTCCSPRASSRVSSGCRCASPASRRQSYRDARRRPSKAECHSRLEVGEGGGGVAMHAKRSRRPDSRPELTGCPSSPTFACCLPLKPRGPGRRGPGRRGPGRRGRRGRRSPGRRGPGRRSPGRRGRCGR